MYKTADVVIFCFSLSKLKLGPRKQNQTNLENKKSSPGHNPGMKVESSQTSSHFSLSNVRTKWFPEVTEVLKKEN